MISNNDSIMKKVLVVDDDATTRYMMRHTLEKAGYKIDDVESGELAIDSFDSNVYDAILLDVDLPGMNGFETCKHIRSTIKGIYTPVIMSTGLNDTSSINLAYDVGVTDFIIKPVNWTILPHRVGHIIKANDDYANLSRNQQRLSNAKKVAGIAEWEYSVNRKELHWSKELYELLKISPENIKPEQQDFILQFVVDDDKALVSRKLNELFLKHLPYEIEYRIIGEDQKEIFIHEHARVLLDEQKMNHIILGTVQDITKLRKTEQRLKYLAHYDQITGLPNRELFKQQLSKEIEKRKRTDSQFAVLFIDIDNFRRINDSLGHDAGDEVIKIIAERLSTSLRSADIITRNNTLQSLQSIARMGGDEFIVLLNEMNSIDSISKIARRLLNVLKKPAHLDNNEIPISASMGIAIYPNDGLDTETIIKNVDTAVNHAKQSGKDNFQFYNKTMNEMMLQHLEFERDLEKAIKLNQFEVYFQPKIDIASGKLVGHEALIRWNHPKLGLVGPDKFIFLAEQSNIIFDLGEWVLEQACKQLVKWHNMGFNQLDIAVNISAKQFNDEYLPARIKKILEKTGLAPKYLELELTEGLLMDNDEYTIKTLNKLKKLGLNLAIDDFGTGYSSLQYLSSFPLDVIKIDRSFIMNLPESKHDMTITKSIVALGHGLGLKVVAEGVEKEVQLKILNKYKCDQVQGFFFSKPMSSAKATEYLKKNY